MEALFVLGFFGLIAFLAVANKQQQQLFIAAGWFILLGGALLAGLKLLL
jgi:hypothetical protein